MCSPKVTYGLGGQVCLYGLIVSLIAMNQLDSTVVQGSPLPPAEHCPAECFCNKPGTSVNCEGKRLTAMPDDIPALVEILYMDHNSFVTLVEGALSNFTHLTHVYLRNNQIQTMAVGAFRNLPLLKELYLTNNYIVDIHPDTFQEVNSLSLLNLGANKMKTIPDLSSLVGLNKLYLEGNQIQNGTFPAGYAQLKNLNWIVLSNNNITKLTDSVFSVLRNSTVRRLEISRNGLNNVSAVALEPLGSLQSLKIGSNPLDGDQLQHLLQGLSNDTNLLSLDIRTIELGGTLPSISFSILSRTPLATLIFRSNKVQRIPDRAFAHLPKLVVLDLTNCQVQNVSDDAFLDLPALQQLFLSNNPDLSTVPRNLPKSLQKLYLQYNNLKTLQPGDFGNLNELRELYLSNNAIHQVSEESFLGLGNLRILHLQNNILSYIPKQLFTPLSSLKTLLLKNNNLKSLKENPGAMASLQALTSLDMSSNQCNYIPYDYFNDLNNLQFLNLESNALDGLLASDAKGILLASMRKLQNLNLANNNLQYIHDAQFRNLFELRHLNLKGNRLSAWGPNLFYTPGSARKTLETVDLSRNQIALVNQTSVQHLQQVTMLDLSLNPFACTCDLRWFRRWLNSTTVTLTNVTTYKCNSPPSWNGKFLLEFDADKINCTDYTWYYVGCAIAITLVIAIIICYIIYHRRWFIRLRFYRLQKVIRSGTCCRKQRRDYQIIEGQNFQDKKYEYYLIAAEVDSEWICDKLLPILDKGPMVHDHNVNYQGPLSIYFEDRDETPGKTKIANFEENMPASRAALIVLTEHLSTDDWCCFLVEQAYTMQIKGEIEHIQIIKVGHPRPRQIPRQMQQAMEKGHYKEWQNKDTVEQDFVDLLRDALRQGNYPVQNQQENDNGDIV